MIDRLKRVDEKKNKNIEIIWGDIENIGGTETQKRLLMLCSYRMFYFRPILKAGLVRECAKF